MKPMYKGNQGYALIIVLWSMVILSIIFVNLVDEVHLNSLLLRNNLDSQNAYQTLVSGFIFGANELKADNNNYDNKEDQWVKAIEGELNNFKYRVKIEDIGSKLNINYLSVEDLQNLNWWDKEVEGYFKERLIPELILLKEIIGDYSKVEEVFTTYGAFNLNNNSLERLKVLMDFLDIDQFESQLILNFLDKKRKEKGIVSKINDLQVLYLQGLSMSTLDKLKDYISTQGSININFASSETLELLFKILKVNRADRIKILEANRRGNIKEISQLKVSDQGIKSYFTTESRYFLIEVQCYNLSGKKVKELRSRVKRIKDDENQWEIKILRWSEK
jgi:general secretion pathway protein K